MRHSRLAGFTLIEMLLVCALSVFVMACLSTLLQITLIQAQRQREQWRLQQQLWHIEQLTLTALESAGFSAAYPADSRAWQILGANASALRLYQYPQEPVPTALPRAWIKKLLVPSTLLATASIDQPQFVQAFGVNTIQIAKEPLAQASTQWLITAPNAWQLLTIQRVSLHRQTQTLYFSTPLSPRLHPPFLAGPYQQQLWFVALNGQHSHALKPQYGLYRLVLNRDQPPDEMISGVSQWQGEIAASKSDGDPWWAKTLTLLAWQVTLTSESPQSTQLFYALNKNNVSTTLDRP